MTIENAILQISNELKIKFEKDGKEYFANEVLTSGSYLSSIVKRAEKLSDFCLGQGIGAIYDNTSAGSSSVRFDTNHSKLITLLFITDVLIELSSGSKKIDLNSLG